MNLWRTRGREATHKRKEKDEKYDQATKTSAQASNKKLLTKEKRPAYEIIWEWEKDVAVLNAESESGGMVVSGHLQLKNKKQGIKLPESPFP